MSNTNEIVYCIRVALNVDKDVDVAKVKLELEELERLAEIGHATEKAFDYFSMGQPSENGTIEFDILTVDDLLDWAKED